MPAFILDVGCGSGLSGEILTEEGHIWVGMDIAPSMLGITSLDLLLICRRGIRTRGRRGSSPFGYRKRDPISARQFRCMYIGFCPAMAFQRRIQ